MAADEKWYFTKEQLANTPSRKCGYDQDKELSYRQQAANFIQDMGQRLLVTQLCINTAIVYMHRFYVFHSFTHFHRNAMAAASLFLAAKVEEQPRKLEHVIKVAHVCLHRDQPSLDTKSEAYLEQAQDLVFNENVLLQTLGFDVAIDHPHTHVVRCCHMVKASKDLAQTSYFMASNSLHLTTMCLQYKPTVVACFCIHLACKWSNWEIPQSNEGKDWFWYVDKTVSLDQLEQLTSEFLVIFDKCPTKLKHKIKSISATQNTSLPPSLANSPFDMEPRKIRPPEGSTTGLSMDLQGPSFRPHHSHVDSKPGYEDPAGRKPQPNSQPPQKVDFREYKEKKERERQEREKMAQASGNRDGHHHHHHHHGQQPPHKAGMTNKAIPPGAPGPHHKPPNSAVTASRDAARREQAHARELNRKRVDFSFGPPVRHEPPADSQPPPAPPTDPLIANHLVNSVVRKEGPDWDVENSDSQSRHEKSIVRHSQAVDPSKRSGLNFDGSVKHSSSKISSDNRLSANSNNSAVLNDTRVSKEPRIPESASNLPKTEAEPLHQKHLFNHNRHKPSEGQELPKRPFPSGHDVSSKRVATTPPMRPIKPEPTKREEEAAPSNGKPPTSHHHGHHRTRDSKSPSLQQLQHRSRSPAISTLATVPAARSKSPLPAVPTSTEPRSKSPSVAPSSHKTSSQSQFFTPGQGVKPAETIPARNGTVSHGSQEEKPPIIEKPSTPPKTAEIELPLTSPVSSKLAQKVATTPEKGGHSLRERESPYPQRQKRQRTPPSSGKKQTLPPPPPPSVPPPDVTTPSSPASGILSPFGSPPLHTPTTPGKVIPSGGTPGSSRITRNRTSSSSSEPELVPLVTKLDQISGYENIIRDSRMSIKLPGPVPDIIQPIRDRKMEEAAALLGAKNLSVAKELKPPELIRPFSVPQSGNIGAVVFPSPVAGNVTEQDSAESFNPTECASVIDVISVTDPTQSLEKTVDDDSKSLVSLLPQKLEVKISVPEHHHKSEKKKKKDKHKHKDKDKNREDRKKSKHKNKDKDRHKDRPETLSVTGTSVPIKITIPKDKLVHLPPAPEPPTSATPNSGLKLKIQRDRLKGADSTGSSPQAVKVEQPPAPLKIKISKDVCSLTPSVPVSSSSSSSSGSKESRKRDRSSPKGGPEQPPSKSARMSESHGRRGGYSKQNGVESRSSGGRGHPGHFTAGTKVRGRGRGRYPMPLSAPPPPMPPSYPYSQYYQPYPPYMYPQHSEQVYQPPDQMYNYYSSHPPPPYVYQPPPPPEQPPLPSEQPPLPSGPPPNPPPPPPE